MGPLSVIRPARSAIFSLVPRVHFLWYGFLVVWALGLLVYGAVAPWAVAASAAALAALNLAAAALLKEPLRLSRATIVFLAGLLAILVFQILPGPAFLFPETQALRGRHGAGSLWPATADSFLTVRAFAQAACCVLAGLLVLRLRQAGLATSTALKGLLAVLALEALAGLVQAFAGLKEIPFYGPRPAPDSASGTLVGRNNFGGLMGLGLVLASGLAFARFAWPPRRKDEEHRPRLLRRFESGSGWALAAGLFAVAVILSKSRGGSLSALAALLLLPFLHRGRAGAAGIATVAVLVLAGVGVANPQGLLDRFGMLDPFDLGDDTRLAICRLTAEASLRQPVLGFGVGTHPQAFHPFQPATLPGQIDHAHNEYVNALFEGGALFLGLLLWGAGLWFVRVWRAQRSLPGPDRIQLTSILAAAVAAALHALVDMDFRVTSIGMLFGALLALGASSLRLGTPRGAWTLSPALVALALSTVLFAVPLNPRPRIDPMAEGRAPLDETVCARVLSLSPYDFAASWMHARAAQARGDLEEADRRFEIATDLFPAHPDLQREGGLWFWVRYAETHSRAQRGRAEKCYARLFRQRPDRVGSVLAEIWLKTLPLEDYEALLPKDPQAVAGLAGFLVERGDWLRAKEVFNRGCPSLPANVAAYDSFAAALERAGQWGLEAEVRKRRLALSSAGAGHAAAARAWERLGAYEEALGFAKTACAIDPTDPRGFAARASIEVALGRSLDAVETLSSGLAARRGSDPGLRLQRARTLVGLKMHGAAARDFQELLRSSRDDLGLLRECANALVAAGDAPGAQRIVGDFLASHPGDAEAGRLRDSLPK